MKTDNLANRTPPLEWAHQAASGRLTGMDWVDPTIDPKRRPFSMRMDGGRIRFAHVPYSAFLPPSLAQAARDAQKQRIVTGQECILLLFSRVEWTLASQDYLWSPLSPVPRILAPLMEAFGVDRSLHKNDPENLARLAALLPHWHPGRGTVERAAEFLDATGEGRQTRSVAYRLRDGPIPRSPSFKDEVFACHSAGWWMIRREGTIEQNLRISGGLLRFQPAEGGAYVLLQEDVLVGWKPDQPVPRDLVRLLPTWTNVRLAVAPGRSK